MFYDESLSRNKSRRFKQAEKGNELDKLEVKPRSGEEEKPRRSRVEEKEEKPSIEKSGREEAG